MYCCENCFSSEYIKPIIRTFSTHKADCDFCCFVNANVCQPRELIEQFRSIVELYVTIDEAKEIEEDLILDESVFGIIHEKIVIDFPSLLFSENVLPNVAELLIAVFKDEEDQYYSILNEPVLFRHLCGTITQARNLDLTTKWDKFVEEIKSKNRFHLSGKIDLDLIGKLFSQRAKEYKKGKIFYRARIGDINGFERKDMWNPPVAFAKSGRANPTGISYLYIAESIGTTLYESRALIYDYVSIGVFRVSEKLNIVNLHDTHLFDPFYLAEEDKLVECLRYMPFLIRLEDELSRPIRRGDNELDYLPTQYLTEFIKSLGYDGVEYKSSLNPGGYNMAAFYPEKFECIEAYVHEVSSITFTHGRISAPMVN